MDFIRKIPTQSCALMLGLSLLGSNFSKTNRGIYVLCALLGFLIFILLTIKIIANFRVFIVEMDDPTTLSIFATYPLGIMVLSGYLSNFNLLISYLFWVIGIVIDLVIIVYFSVKYLKHLSLYDVTPAWYIVYTGLAMIAVTFVPFNHFHIAKLFFWISVLSFIGISIPIVKANRLDKCITRRPVVCVYAFPASMLLAGYINIYQDKYDILMNIFILVSQFIYVYVLFRLFQIILMKTKFNTNFSTFTFPLVTSAISIKMAVNLWTMLNENVRPFDKFSKIELFISGIATIYVIARYAIYIYKKYRDKDREIEYDE